MNLAAPAVNTFTNQGGTKMKAISKILSLILAATMALSAFSIAAFADPAIGTATMTVKLTDEAGNPLASNATLAPGDVFNVVLNLQTDYYVGSTSFVWHYDSTIFQPARDGVAFTAGTADGKGITSSNAITGPDYFFTFPGDNPTDHNDNGQWLYHATGMTLSGRVNCDPSKSGNALYYPPSWIGTRQGVVIGDRTYYLTDVLPYYYDVGYINFMVNCGLGSPSGGVLETLTPSQDIVQFQMMVREDAPETTSAHFWMNQDCLKTSTYPNGKIYINKLANSSVSSTLPSVGMDYNFVNTDYNFTIENGNTATSTVSFDLNGGTGTAPESVTGEVGTNVALPAGTGITKEGYTFAGWATTNDATQPLASFTFPETDTTLYAVYTVNSYDINYYVDGVLEHTDTYAYGAAITPLAEPTKTGYTFSGWSPAIPATMPAQDLNINGSFTPNTYYVNYYVDGELYSSVPYTYGSTIVPIAEPTKTGCDFSGWSEIPTTMPAEDVTVTGTFSDHTYYVYYLVDGELYESASYTYGATIVPLAEPAKTGYTFSGWSEIPATMPPNDVTVNGTFTANTYYIKYYVDGELFQTVSYYYNDAVTPLAEPTKTGYTFSGWSEIPATMPADDVNVTGTFTSTSIHLRSGRWLDDIVITQNYGTAIAAP